MVLGLTYEEILEKTEKKLSDFFQIPVDELEEKLSYEITIWESSDDGITAPIFSAEVISQVKKEIK